MAKKQKNAEKFSQDYNLRLFRSFSFLAMFFLLPYAVIQFLNNQKVLAIVYILAAGCIAALSFVARQPKYTKLAMRSFAAIGPIVLLPWQVTGGIDSTGMFWFFAYIVFVLSFLDLGGAIFWLVITYAGSLCLAVASSQGLIQSHYSTNYLSHFYFASILTVLLLGIFVHLREQLRNNLEKSSHSLGEAQSIANIGSWEWEIKSGTLHLSDQLCVIYNLKPHTKLEYDSYMKLVFPDDHKLVETTVNKALENKESFEIEYRVRLSSGEIKWINGKGRIITDNNGDAIRMAGTAQDITDKKQIENELRIQNVHLRQLEKVTVDRELRMLELKDVVSNSKEKTDRE